MPSWGDARARAISLVVAAAVSVTALGAVAADARVDAALARLAAGWQAAGNAHPLVGRLWSAAGGGGARTLGDQESATASPGSPVKGGVRLVGEVHDNDEHHRLQAVLVNGAAGAVVFEQLRSDQQPAIDAFMALPKSERSVAAFLDAVAWPTSGWAKYDYMPLFAAVIGADVPIYAGDAPRDAIRKAAKEGAQAVPADEQKRLALDVPFDARLHEASLTEIEASHCGLMPKSAFGGMAFAQRLRDATLADVTLAALERHGAVTVFAGNGHVRTDRGVAWYIRQRAPSVPVSATVLVEVEEGRLEPGCYLPRDPEGRPAADAIVFTPRQQRPDPCEEMRRSMRPAPK